jgi:hypothetical protein
MVYIIHSTPLTSYHQLPNKMTAIHSNQDCSDGTSRNGRSKSCALLVGKSVPDIPTGNSRRYLWSPKRNSNGTKTPLFPNCTVVSHCYESPKLAEFGEVGLNWEAIGRRVRVNFTFLAHRIRSKDQIDLLRSVLPGLVFSVTKVWERHSLDMSHRRSRLSRDLHRLSRCGGHHTGTSQRCVALNPEESVQNLRSSESAGIVSLDRSRRMMACSSPSSLFARLVNMNLTTANTKPP